MAGEFNVDISNIDCVAQWLSCNGEVWGMGPTAVFASAAALFLYNELEATVLPPGNNVHATVLEKTLLTTMLCGMLALMIHLWVCSMRFFQYYLDTLIKDSPSMLLEMTTVSLLGSPPEIVPLGSVMRFLKQQQPQIHMTICWFLSLCYADYVRKHYCRRFNMPYLEQWQTELQERASHGVHRTMERVNGFVTAVHTRLRGYAPIPPTCDARTVVLRGARRRWRSAGRAPGSAARSRPWGARAAARRPTSPTTPSLNCARSSLKHDVYVRGRRAKATAPSPPARLKATLSAQVMCERRETEII